jgi:hypothetical protein
MGTPHETDIHVCLQRVASRLTATLHLKPGLSVGGALDALKTRTGRVPRKATGVQGFGASSCPTALKIRPNFRRNFVRGLSTPIRDLSAA